MSTVAHSTKLIGVLRKPTRSRANSNSSKTSSTTSISNSNRHSNNNSNSNTPREEELHSAIQRLRIQDGDEGYKKNPNMIPRSNGNGYGTTYCRSSSATTSGQTDTSRVSSSIQESDDSWRKDGRERRREILEDDKSNGGTDFHINHQSPLRTYSAIADRVREQFQQAYSSPGTSTSELQAIYIMGNRLINFLATVLPTHHQYLSKRPEHTRLRVRIQHDLMLVRHQVEDVALKLDKEFYRQQMEEQGLEFVHHSPPRHSGRKERVRKVKFNLGCEKIVYQIDGDETMTNTNTNKNTNKNTNTSTSLGDAFEIDLAVWGERDPDFGESSFLSDDASSSFESSFSNMEGGCQVQGSGSSSFDFGIEYEGQEEGVPFSLEEEVLNVFGGMDDGWEHYDANKASDESLEWPEMSRAFPTKNDEMDPDMTGSTANSTNENDSSEMNQSSFSADGDDCDDHSISSQESGSSSGSDEQFLHGIGDHSFESEISESFVEKISRENFCRAIDELQDNDDDSAQDSWAPSQQDEFSVANQETQCSIPIRAESLVPEKTATSPCRRVNHDELESSIDGFGHHKINAHTQESLVDEAHQITALPRAKDVLESLCVDQSLDYSVESHTSLEFSYSSSKINSENNYLSSSAEEFDSTEDDISLVLDLQEDFDSSQIIAESPSFEQSEEENEDIEHDEFILSLTEEFSDQSDSSGASKTFVTASTADCTVDEHSSRGSFERDEQTREDNVLGIIRRDTYIPTIDSPHLPRKQLGDELDYLESKVKNLQDQQNKDSDQRTKEQTFPLQIARDEYNHSNEQRIQSLTPKKEANAPACPSNITTLTDDKVEESNTTSTFSRTRRHPTAARLKALRQSSAWKRRYGRKD